MKINAIVLVMPFILGACSSSKELSYRNSPVINAKTDYSEYRIGDAWYKGDWGIAPEIEHDTLTVICYNLKETFEFRTDMDRIAFEIEPNSTRDFYVRMDENTYV